MEYGASKAMPKKVDKAYDRHLKKTFDTVKRNESGVKGTFEQLLNSGFIKGMQSRADQNLTISKEFAIVREERKKKLNEDAQLVERFEKGILQLWSKHSEDWGSASKSYFPILAKFRKMRKNLTTELALLGHYSVQQDWNFNINDYISLLLLRGKERPVFEQIIAEKKKLLKQLELSIIDHKSKVEALGYVLYKDHEKKFDAKVRSASIRERNDEDYFPSYFPKIYLSYLNWATIITSSLKLLNEKGGYNGDLGSVENAEVRRTVGKIAEVSSLADQLEADEEIYIRRKAQSKLKNIESELRYLFSQRNKEGGMEKLLEALKACNI